jgi:hypothetical protein
MLIWKPVACLKSAIFLGNRGCVAVASFLIVPLALDQSAYYKLIDSGSDIPTLPLENMILVTAFGKRSNRVKKQVMIEFSIGEICLK